MFVQVPACALHLPPSFSLPPSLSLSPSLHFFLSPSLPLSLSSFLPLSLSPSLTLTLSPSLSRLGGRALSAPSSAAALSSAHDSPAPLVFAPRLGPVSRRRSGLCQPPPLPPPFHLPTTRLLLSCSPRALAPSAVVAAGIVGPLLCRRPFICPRLACSSRVRPVSRRFAGL